MKKKINLPKLPSAYRPVSQEDWEERRIEQAKFTNENLKINSNQEIRFSACQFENTHFELTDNSVSEFMDCVFEHCDFSN